MAKDITKALDEVDITYDQIKQIAEDMLSEDISPINQLVKDIEQNIENISVDALRGYMLKLQLVVFQLSELKDKTSVKAQCAEAVKKEAYAMSFLSKEGTVNQRESSATIDISENIVVECLYEFASNLIKTKVDQGLRLIDTLKSILMSRMQEMKISNMNITD